MPSLSLFLFSLSPLSLSSLSLFSLSLSLSLFSLSLSLSLSVVRFSCCCFLRVFVVSCRSSSFVFLVFHMCGSFVPITSLLWEFLLFPLLRLNPSRSAHFVTPSLPPFPKLSMSFFGRRNHILCRLWGCPRFSVQCRRPQAGDIEQANVVQPQSRGSGFRF